MTRKKTNKNKTFNQKSVKIDNKNNKNNKTKNKTKTKKTNKQKRVIISNTDIFPSLDMNEIYWNFRHYIVRHS